MIRWLITFPVALAAAAPATSLQQGDIHRGHAPTEAHDLTLDGESVATAADGGTGRATGTHLHWGTSWTDVRVDPARLLALPPTDPPR